MITQSVYSSHLIYKKSFRPGIGQCYFAQYHNYTIVVFSGFTHFQILIYEKIQNAVNQRIILFDSTTLPLSTSQQKLNTLKASKNLVTVLLNHIENAKQNFDIASLELIRNGELDFLSKLSTNSLLV